MPIYWLKARDTGDWQALTRCDNALGLDGL